LWQILEANYASLRKYVYFLLFLTIVRLIFSRPLIRWRDRMTADVGVGNRFHFFVVENLLKTLQELDLAVIELAARQAIRLATPVIPHSQSSVTV
jgi:hypothetical protein